MRKSVRLGLVVAAVFGAACGDDGGKHTDAPTDTTSNSAVLHVDNLTGHFGSVMTTTTSPAMAFTISNTGVATSGAITATLSGSDASNFAIASNTCATLAPAATCQISVTFTPVSSGTKTANVAIAAAPGGAATIALDGIGISGGALSIMADTNALGGVLINTTGATTATFTVTNNSGDASGALSIEGTGSDPGEFALGADTCSTHALPSGGMCTFVASFTPHSRGPKSASYEVTGMPGGTVVGTVNGIGLAPAQLVFQQQVLDFGSVALAGTGQLSVTAINVGDVATGAIASGITGTNASDFTLATDACNTQVIAPLGTCAVVVTFTASAVGTRSAQLALGAMPGGPAVALLTANALAANGLAISPPSVQFPSTPVGQSAMQTFTIANHATTTSGSLASVLDGATASQFTLANDTCTGNALAASATCTIDVTFTPTVNGPAAATLAITSQQLGNVAAALSGLGLGDPVLAIAPAARDYGSVAVGAQSATQTFTVTNAGGQPSGMPTVTLGGASAAQYAIVATDCTTQLAPAATCTAQVRFAPTVTGAAAATLVATATPGSSATSTLAGIGIAADGIAIEPSTFTFATTSVGDSATAQTFTVKNLGTTTTGTLAVTTAGTNATDFVSTNTCATLAGGATCTITTTFTPSAIGTRTATVSVTGAPGGTATLALAGDGRARLEIIALNGATPTNPYDFGSTIAAFGTADVIITLRNNTSTAKPLTVTGAYGTPPQFATLDNACGATIASSIPCIVRVRFAPTVVGPQTGSTTFSIGATPADTTVQSLTGAGSALNDHPPTAVSLAPTSVAENQPSGTQVGQLTSNDPDPSETFTYSLVTGAGSTDNASFTIAGDKVLTAASFDFETKSSYSIRVRTTDSGFQTFEAPITITITDANDAPTNLALAPASIQENQPIGATIGAFTTTDQDVGDSFTYTLVAGAGSTDNASFGIAAGTLVSAASFDFETKSSYSIRVRTTDHAGTFFEKQFAISIANANEAPTAIALAGSSVVENQPTGTVVGMLAATDPDAGDTFTFALAAGGPDNGSFSIVGNQLRTADVFDFETRASYSILVQVTDAGGLSFQQAFTITITNANDPPTAIMLPTNSIPENQPTGTAIGTFITSDQDATDTHTYTLVAGAGSTDNASFAISGSTLNSAAMFDFETKNQYFIRVRSTDAGGQLVEAQFTIIVTDVLEGPNDIALSSNTVPENSAINTIVGALSSVSPQPGVTFTYALVAGTGGDDNASFNINGANLRSSAIFDFETKGTYLIRVRSTDSNNNTFEKPLVVTVSDVDEAPVVATTPSTISYTENGAPLALDTAVTVTDPDAAGSPNATIKSATVAISTNCRSGEDVLAPSATLPTGITLVGYNAGTCTLTLTGLAMPAMYATALQGVTYANSSDNPNTGSRTVRFTVVDNGTGGAATGNNTRALSVIAVNDAPVVITSSGTSTFTEKSPAVLVDSAVTVTDVDSTNLSFATVTITNLLDSGAETLSATGAAGFTLVYAAPTLTITATTAKTPAQFQAVLQTVKYNNTSANPTTTARVIAFQADDGATANHLGAAANKSVTIVAVNDAPVVTTTAGTTAYTENGATLAIDTGLTTSDVDSASFVGATVAITGNYATGEDVLSFTNTAAITGSFNATTGVLTLTGSDTVANYQAALRSVGYSNSSDNPSTAQRTISFQVNDGGTANNLSGQATKQVSVTAVNDAPSLVAGAMGTAFSYTENGAAAAIAPSITPSDVDNATLASATITVTNWDGTQDVITTPSVGGISCSQSGTTTLTIACTGSAASASYQTLLRGVAYHDTSDNPSTTDRVVSYVVSDGVLSSTALAGTLHVIAVNDPPVVTTPAATAITYYAGTAAMVIDSSFTITDADSTNLTGATVQITTGCQSAEDRLAFTNAGGISGSVNNATCTLTLAGSATLAQYATALATVTYATVDGSPSTADRTVSFIGDDGGSPLHLSAAATSTIHVQLNAPPVVTTTGGSTSFTEGGGPIAIDTGITVTDANDANLASGTVTLSATPDGAAESLDATVTGTSISKSYTGGVLTLTGTDTKAHYQAVLRTVTYNDTSHNPTTTTRTASFVVTDPEGANSTSSTKQVSITAVNDAPVLVVTNPAPNFIENGSAVQVDGAIAVSDVDSTTLTGATAQLLSAPNGVNESLVATTTGTSITASYSGGTLTLSGADTLAHYQTVLRTITYTNTAHPPNTTTRQIQIQLNDGGTANNLSTVGTDTVSITAVNTAPVLASAGTASYTEGLAAAVVAPAMTVVDTDSPNLASAAIAITTGFQASTDQLSLTLSGGVTGTYSAATGTIALSGSASPATYQAILRSVTFSSTSHDPSTATRTVTMQVDDGAATSHASNVLSSTVAVTAVNNPPTANAKTLGAQAGLMVTYPAGTLTGQDDPAEVANGSTVSVVTTPGNVCTNCAVTLRANGGFDFTPPPDAAGTSVTFTFQVVDTGNPTPVQTSASATVTMTVAGPAIYFVQHATVGTGTCSFGNECTLDTALTKISTTTNAVIFLDDMSTSTHAGTIALNAGGSIVGQGATGTFATMFGITTPVGATLTTPALGQTPPTITLTATGAVGIDLGEGSKVSGIKLGTPGGDGIRALNRTSATVTQVGLTQAGGASCNSGIDFTSSGGTIGQNTVTVSAGASMDCVGIEVIAQASTGQRTLDVSGNTVGGNVFNAIAVFGGGAASALALTLHGNALSTTDGDPGYAIDIVSGAVTNDASCMFLDLGDTSSGHVVTADANVITGTWQGASTISLAIFDDAKLDLKGLTGTSDANAASYAAASNTGGPTDAVHLGSQAFGSAACF